MNGLGKRRLCVVLAASLLGLPATASAASNWGFGPAGQKSATITWEPADGADVTAVVFTLPVKAKRGSTRQGHRCTVPRKHPRQVRCTITPAAAYGYIDVIARVRIPCKSLLKFSAKPIGGSKFVRQPDIPSGNGCS